VALALVLEHQFLAAIESSVPVFVMLISLLLAGVFARPK
jgi:hypothetical protein